MAARMLADTDCQEVTLYRQQDIDYNRVSRGIEYITTHYRNAPELADIAAAAHLSPFHFQRLFTAWAGVSPKSFTRYLGLAHARDALRHGTKNPRMIVVDLSTRKVISNRDF